jgi:PIN domain nuclease of toxin-antitoxin system
MDYVTDTHSLVWYLTNDKRLGKKALAIFDKADNDEVAIIIPTIALAEIIHICEKKKIDLKIKEVVEKIHNSSNYIPYNLNMAVLEKSISLKNITELHDRIIAATTKMIKAKLITKDEEITKSGVVETLW